MYVILMNQITVTDKNNDNDRTTIYVSLAKRASEEAVTFPTVTCIFPLQTLGQSQKIPYEILETNEAASVFKTFLHEAQEEQRHYE